ncbi:MAG: hypothetical protein V4722_15385 [Bacteroidota bacterium]
MDNKDFDIFKQEVDWFFKPTDKVDLTIAKTNFSNTFISSFPTLHTLISQATILDIKLRRKDDITYYKLFSWTDKDNLNSGWLCKFETNGRKIEILEEHQLLLDNIGGIQESYKQLDTDKEMLTDNQNFAFIKSECRKGLGDWTKIYDQTCEDEDAKQIKTKDLLCFVGEANGNETFYNLNTKQVLLFASDHCFENVEVLKGQPAYTFYTINGVTTFVDYVETLSQQWLDNIVTADN